MLNLNKGTAYILTFILTILIGISVFSAHHFSLYIPRNYTSDTVFSCTFIKTIIETGWGLTSLNLSAPGLYQLYDFPMADNASILIIRFLTLFSKNYAVVINCFYFLTFPLVALFSLFAFLKLNLKPVFAVAASLLFTFLPYHFFRNESHLLLNTYYVIPIFTLFAITAYRGEPFFSPSKSTLCWRILGILFAASSGVYYAFFGAFFILIAGIYGWIKNKQPRARNCALIFCLFIAITNVLNVAPSIVYQYHYGKNTAVANRVGQESEIAGLKIVQMLLPVNEHHIHLLAKFKDIYNTSAPLVNENRTATLGLLGSIGFIMLLWLLIMRRKENLNSTVELFSVLNISSVLLATIGGFGTVIAYVIFPDIRSYNRISVFISFYCIFTVFHYLQMRYDAKKYLALLVIITILGLWDEIPSQGINPNYHTLKAAIANDYAFTQQIEKILPINASVFQLPYSAFPEGPKVVDLVDYEQFKLYLSSDSNHLRWSYGSMNGRSIAAWQEKVAGMPCAEMAQQLVLAGFSGIVVYRVGYADQGKKIVADLSNLLKQKPIADGNNQLLFFNLQAYKQQLEKKLGQSKFDYMANQTIKNAQLQLRFGRGFDDPDISNNHPYAWVKNKAHFFISNAMNQSATYHLKFLLQAEIDGTANVTFNSDLFNTSLQVDRKGVIFQRDILLPPNSKTNVDIISTSQNAIMRVKVTNLSP